MAGSGLPFQIAAERQVDRSGDPRRLAAALASGQTAYLPQVHQVLPRLMRLMVSLRSHLLQTGPGAAPRAECSFLFVVEGAGRAGMGLHHDGDVDAFWLQLEGRRTVTIGPRVPPGTPEELEDRTARDAALDQDGAPSTSSPARCSTCPPGRRMRSCAGAARWPSRSRGSEPRGRPRGRLAADTHWRRSSGGTWCRDSRSRFRGRAPARSGRRYPSSSRRVPAASPTFACGRPTAKGRGCRPGQAPGPTVSP